MSAAASAGQGAGTSTLRGTITTKAKPATGTIKVTADHKVCGDAVPDESLRVGPGGGVANAVVIVTGTTGGAPADPVVSNRKCAFAPRVQLGLPKSTATLTSEDPLLHNTHAYDERQRSLFNIAIPAPGLNVRRPLRNAGVVTVKCDVHPWMRGFVIVTDELAAVSNEQGAFEIANVPAGTHQVRVWHEGLSAAPQSATVTPGKPATVSFVLGK